MKERRGFTPRPEGQDRNRELIDRLEAQVGAIQDSESFQKYLSVQARFHKYSWGNTLLIAMQRPDATQVAGYQTWAKMGRQVMRGEKGIAIMVPHMRKVEDEKTGEAERRVMGFGVGHVFDYSQTSGDPLPTIDVPTLEGIEGEELYGRLARVTYEEKGELYERADFDADTMGFYVPSTRHITVRPHHQLQMTKTLAHELGHMVHLTYRGEESQDRDEREAVAEATAYVVLASQGLDSTARSVPYIANWTKDRDRFRNVLGTVQGVASTIIDRLNDVPHGRPDGQSMVAHS